MTKTIGHKVADQIYNKIKKIIRDQDQIPHLAVVQVGNDSASNIYIKYKRNACKKLNFDFTLKKFDNTIKTSELVLEIQELNNNPSITGIIIQLPIPLHINKYEILNCVDPEKDVDCFHSENIAKLYFGYDTAKYIPATVYGIYELIKYSQIETKGKTCVIIGKSNIVGKPLQLLLSDENDMACTTILCDKYTQNLKQLTQIADILIVAAGKHHLISDETWIKKDAVVIDVGIHKIKKKIYGDVNYDKLKSKCSLITPVPSGVGPITVASLMYNLIM